MMEANLALNPRRWLPAVFLIFCLALLAGCSSGKAAQKAGKETEAKPTRHITSVRMAADDDAVRVLIQGTGELTYSSVKQPDPLAVVLYFPQASVEGLETSFPPHEIITGIHTSQAPGDAPSARMEILLAKDVSYDVTREPDGLAVVFKTPKLVSMAPSDTASDTAPAMKSAPEPAPEPMAAAPEKAEPVMAAMKEDSGADTTMAAEHEMPAATMLRTVRARKGADHVTVSVLADGEIKNFETTVIDKGESPRIVFDIFGIQSPFTDEQTVPVDSKWVRQVRHYYWKAENRVRVVLDTRKEYLDRFTATPVSEGLAIRVGQTAAPAMVKETATAAAITPPAKTAGDAAAWVNRIDFVSGEAGKSTVIVGATRPVEYRIRKAAANRIYLDLSGARLPDYRERPLITTRFESAVDRVMPVRIKGEENGTRVQIELREAVPYFVEQVEDLILVHFDPSSVPPRSLESAGLPDWKTAMAQAETEPGETAPDMAETPMAEEPKQPAPGTQQGTFTGEKIALEFYNTDIKNVFRILREISGKNFAIDRDVNGQVTLFFDKPVPWDQVLDIVLRMNQLGMTYEGDIIRIATQATLRAEQAQARAMEAERQQLQETKKALEPLATHYFDISYSSAQDDILPHLQKILTADRGTLSVDGRTNLIIMTDTQEKIDQAAAIVRRLDRVTQQVIIEARVVEADVNFTREIGVSWNLSTTLEDGKLGRVGGSTSADLGVNLPTTTQFGGVLIGFSRAVGSPFTLDALLEAMESTGKGRIISTPRVLTLDNTTATIKQGLRYPYNRLDDSGNTVTVFEDIDLSLEVTPHVTPDQRVTMQINIAKKDLGNVINNQQSFTTKEAQTELLVNDGDTVVIGGIIKTTERNSESGLPGLRKIPVLGWLFKSRATTNDKEELLIFITPRIVQLEKPDLLEG